MKNSMPPDSSHKGGTRDQEPAPWFETAFESGYLELYAHRDQASAEREVAGLLRRGFASGQGRVLDLCCGNGRHARAFLRAGLDVVGLDLSRDLLQRASSDEGGVLAQRLVRGDVRRLPFRGGSFDAVAMLFSSWGYFTDEDNRRVLDAIAGVLGPGGTLLLDLMNADRIRRTLVPESRDERDGRLVIQRRRLEQDGKRVVKEVRIRSADGALRTWHEDVRLMDPGEIEALLRTCGFQLMRLEGDFDGRAFDSEGERMLVWARRLATGASPSKTRDAEGAPQ